MTERKATNLFVFVGILTLLTGCAGVVPTHISTTPPSQTASWLLALTANDIAVVRQEFSQFSPEAFAPGISATNRSASNLTPNNFLPAQFFGPAQAQGFKPTPKGLMIETNGFDQTIPSALAPNGVYFNPAGVAMPYTLGTATMSPVNMYRADIKQAAISNAPVLAIDDSDLRVDPNKVDSMMFSLRDQFATINPKIADIDPTTVKIVFEPTIFNEEIGNNPPTWTDGFCSIIGGDRSDPTIYVSVFYISASGKVYSWQDALVNEAMDYYTTLVGDGPVVRQPLTAFLDPFSFVNSRSSLVMFH